MAVMKLHGNARSTATIRALASIYEKGIDFEFVPVNMAAGDHKKEAFISLNPFGQVPALEDEDLKLFESRAITQYIAHKYAKEGNQLIYEDPKKMATLCVWMAVEAHQFYEPASKLLSELVVKPFFGGIQDDAVVEQNEAKLAKVLDVYEARLAQTKYLGGDTFTLADLHHLPNISYLMDTRAQKLFDARPHVSAWSTDIQARPAWLKVLAMRT